MNIDTGPEQLSRLFAREAKQLCPTKREPSEPVNVKCYHCQPLCLHDTRFAIFTHAWLAGVKATVDRFPKGMVMDVQWIVGKGEFHDTGHYAIFLDMNKDGKPDPEAVPEAAAEPKAPEPVWVGVSTGSDDIVALDSIGRLFELGFSNEGRFWRKPLPQPPAP